MDVSTVGDRTVMVAIMAMVVGSMGFATSVMAMWINWFLPSPPSKPITRESLDRLHRLHDSDARSITSTEAESHSTSISSRKRTPLPMKKSRSRSQQRPHRHVSFNDPAPVTTTTTTSTATSTATVTLTLVSRLKPKRRASSPLANKSTIVDDLQIEDTTEDKDDSPLSSSDTLTHPHRRPNLLRITAPWKTSRHAKRDSTGSVGFATASSAAINVTEFDEKASPHIARAVSFAGRKADARDSAGDGSLVESERERGRFAWRLKRSKTVDVPAGEAIPAGSAKPATSRLRAKRFSTSPLRLGKLAHAPSTPPPSPPAPKAALAPIVTTCAPAPKLASPGPGGSPSCPSRRLSSYLTHALSPHHSHGSPCPSPPQSQPRPRTQPYGPPYNVMPPDAGVWAEKEGEERPLPRRQKRMSAPAAGGAAAGTGARRVSLEERRRGTEPILASGRS